MAQIEVKTLKLNAIKPNPDNPRQISKTDMELLVKSLKEFPEMTQLREIVVDENMIILGGNMRYRAMKKIGEKECLVKIVSGLSPEQKREFIVKDNASFGDWDMDALANAWADLPLVEWGVDLPENWAAGGKPEAKEDDFDAETAAKEIVNPITKTGDVWLLDKHRVMCGDSTQRKDVEALLSGEKADMCFTDPPYGVNVKGGRGKGNLIAGDLTQTAIPFSFELAVEIATKEKAHFYFCGSEGNIQLYQNLFDRYLHILPKHLIWVKNGFVMKQNGYHNQFEIIFHGYKVGSGALWYGGRKENEASDVWHVNRDASRTYVHPTQKPIELPSRAIRNSCPASGSVFDAFGGSGSTLIACEQLNRTCYGMEIDPVYCDVIVKRWETLTGKKAVLES